MQKIVPEHQLIEFIHAEFSKQPGLRSRITSVYRLEVCDESGCNWGVRYSEEDEPGEVPDPRAQQVVDAMRFKYNIPAS